MWSWEGGTAGLCGGCVCFETSEQLLCSSVFSVFPLGHTTDPKVASGEEFYKNDDTKSIHLLVAEMDLYLSRL